MRGVNPHPRAGPQRPFGVGSHRTPGYEVEPVALHHHSHDEGRLHEREVLADAQARAAPEREVGEPRPAVAVPGGEAIGVEALGVRPELLPAVGDVRAQNYLLARGDRVAPDLVLPDGFSGDHPRRRVEPERLVQDRPRVREVLQVLDPGRPVPEDAPDLFAYPAGDPGALGEQVPGPRQRHGRRLVSGEVDRGDLVPDLAVRHPLPGLLVARPHEHPEEVVPVPLTLTAPLADDALDRLVYRRESALETAVRRQGQPRHPQRDQKPRVYPFERRLEGAGDPLAFLPDVAPEHGLHDDPLRQQRHLHRDIEGHARRGPSLPPVEHRRGLLDHRFGESCQAFAMKGRLHQPPLLAPESPLAQHEPVPEQHRDLVVPLHVIPGVLLQHVADVLRVAQQVEPLRGELYSRHVAPLARGLEQGSQRPALKLRQVADEREPLYAWYLGVGSETGNGLLHDLLLPGSALGVYERNIAKSVGIRSESPGRNVIFIAGAARTTAA